MFAAVLLVQYINSMADLGGMLFLSAAIIV
jgi:hypothetical protein